MDVCIVRVNGEVFFLLPSIDKAVRLFDVFQSA